MNLDQSVTERQAMLHRDEVHVSDVKTIVLHVIDDESHDQRINSALALARACDAHLTCLHVTPIGDYAGNEILGGILALPQIINAYDDRDKRLRHKVEARLAREDVRWDYQQSIGRVCHQIVQHAALADLLITARDPDDDAFVGPSPDFLARLIEQTQTPVLIPPVGKGAIDPFAPALIAWDGSFEAGNAVRSSLGLLKLARRVEVITVLEDLQDARKRFPATHLLRYLSQHGIEARLTIDAAPSRVPSPEMVATTLVAAAEAIDASYLVMGAFSHRRLREILFGGVTRVLFNRCSVALLIGH